MTRPTLQDDRKVAFESFEDRLALTAQALNDLADEWRDTPIQTMAAAAASSTSEGHGWAEIAYARNEMGLRGGGQTVAVIDSGIAYDHIALGGGLGAAYKVVGGWDFAENDANPYDDGPAGFHGTHVSGIIGSSDKKYMGVAPDVDLVALRVFDDNGGGTLERVEQALRWVHDNRNTFANPITTVNLSLGTAWNSSNLPDWAVLEDEFRMLEEDGIFIAVAAGNSFATYKSEGLSYPAASQYVVPVASIGASGQFSSFSQRSDRVLAAPGEKVMSTLPDHFYGGDGLKNDMGATSGTSMAAPYVAGASVLLREAMAAMGQTNITQDVLYDWLKNTADTLYDSVTNANYSKLNLQKALDTLVGADEFGSTAADATSIGNLTTSITVSGTIGKVSDSDFFRFTAAASGQVTFTLDTIGDLAGKWQTPDGGTINGDTVTMNVVAGQSYRLGLGTSDGIGKFTIEAKLTSSTTETPPPPTTPNPPTPPALSGNWGVVSGNLFDNFNLQTPSNFYQLTAGRTGMLTVEALFSAARGNIDIEVYDSQNRLVGSSATADSSERVDISVTAGNVYYVRATGVNRDVDFRVTNLVTVSGSQVDVGGTSARDLYTWTHTGTQQQLAVNGVTYTFAANSQVQIQGVGGIDALTLVSATGTVDTITTRPGSVDLVGSSYRVSGLGVEQTNIRGDANDRVTMYDSAGVDYLEATATFVGLVGTGHQTMVEGIRNITVISQGGGDVARLNGTRGNDRFVIEQGNRTLTNSSFNLRVENFASVGFHGLGGTDTVEITGMNSNDLIYGRRGIGRYTTAAYKTEFSDIDQVLAQARVGEKLKSDVRSVDYLFRKLSN
ncbi:Subtilisin E precursor [Anatilimnocola aggregata]|uniref:Subtilisin E n=1 Tax=Anatilimnocola aggregata TaxID=2528021 RepID=A0A517YE72_9BACT|nr:S8 family serine peptidase [Anatilimnocola aggregata]QDU28462.1 Subtilisin E precursor [Anatilimnocola aggregata]